MLLLVNRLSQIYKAAGGEVTGGAKGAFARFLGILYPLLPRHLQSGDVDWFAGYAKKLASTL